MLGEEDVEVVLAKGERVFAVKTGDLLEDGYRVESVEPTKVVLKHVVDKSLHVLPLLPLLPPLSEIAAAQREAPLAPDGPAKIEWQGPDQVRAGDHFEVSLKVKSAAAILAAPVEIAFDPSVVQPVDVRAGRFFFQGSFSYRINPAGRIVIGAAGKSGLVSDEDELFVVSLRPLGPADAVELRLSHLVLHGAAGSQVQYEPPAVFRTAVIH